MASAVEEFLNSPDRKFLDQCTKDQLLKLAQHYKVTVDARRTRDTIQSILQANLQEEGVMVFDDGRSGVTTSGPGLTFEQQKELLLLKMEHEIELEKIKSKMEHEKEKMKLEVEREKLGLIAAGKLPASVTWGEREAVQFDVTKNLRLMPKFDDADVDTFFAMFERVADARGWPDEERTIMLQCVFTGKAQEVYSSMSVEDCKSYEKVKTTVLKAYELVAEAYRQKFRGWRKIGEQTHVEFARDLGLHFNRWCRAANVETFSTLCDLIVLEQFKQAVPDNIATYITERNVITPNEAAVIADEYVLTHKRFFGERLYLKRPRFSEGQPQKSLRPQRMEPHVNGKVGPEVCHYCRQEGHWKKECPVLNSRGKTVQVKSAGLVAPVGRPVGSVKNSVAPFVRQGQTMEASDADSGYHIFISDGFVRMGEDDTEIPVKILRDSGSMHTFVRKDILPFSPQSDTGGCVPCRGLALQTLFVPEHKIFLSCGFFQKDVVVAVRAELPVRGVDVILGNDLVPDGRMWPDDVRPALEQKPKI